MSKNYTYRRYELDEAREQAILEFYLKTGESVKVVAENFNVSKSIADKIINKYLKEKSEKWKNK